MAAKFLTEEWAQTLTAALNADADFRDATRKRQAVLGFHVSAAPEGDVWYALELNRGESQVTLGQHSTPDMTFDMDYEVAKQIAQGTLGGREAFAARKMTADVGMVTLMKFAPVFIEHGRVGATLEFTY